MTFKAIRTSKFSRILVSYLSIQLVISVVHPNDLWALTSGPSQPEFNTFTPIGTSEMVDLSSGDFNYNIPVMDVGGYPINLSYNSGITMDQEASWVGLGWNLNVGHIDRSVRGIPDDFNGKDSLTYRNYMKPNTTVGAAFNVSAGLFGIEALNVEASGNVGLTVLNNNYEGTSFTAQNGVGFNIADVARVGLDISSSVTDGVNVQPSLGLGFKLDDKGLANVGAGLSLNYNSREGYKNLSMYSNISPVITSVGVQENINFNDPTFTPMKRIPMKNSAFTYYASAGATLSGVDFQFRVEGFGSTQEVAEKLQVIPAYGYENTEQGHDGNAILDFNRSKDRNFNENTTALPVTNYTYDTYSVNAQGLGGNFRPYRNHVGFVHDPEVKDNGNGKTLGGRVGTGLYAYFGVEKLKNTIRGKSGDWKEKNYVRNSFLLFPNDLKPKDEKIFYKFSGDLTVNRDEISLFENKLYGERPINFEVGGSEHGRILNPKVLVGNPSDGLESIPPSQLSKTGFKTENRQLRHNNVYSVSNKEALSDPTVEHRTESYAKPHHQVGVKILKSDGSQYVFGKSLYNTKKLETTFDVSKEDAFADCSTGLITVAGGISGHHSLASDQYLNQVTTPSYVHTYLLSSVLSTDYEDIDGNGPTLNDLGSYTLFNYKGYNSKSNNIAWRMPYQANTYSYNEGLKTEEHDEKASYLYGEKEQSYINTIETKTHVAYFELENRNDARAAIKENEEGEILQGTLNTAGYSKNIKRIYLFSKPEYEKIKDKIGTMDNPQLPYEEMAAKAVKVAHFEYDYSLCQGVPNNLSGGGKLTLKKVYFTYRGSNLGMYTPYVFNYDNFNPPYNSKSVDIWGTYKSYNEDLLQTDENGDLVVNPILDPRCDALAPLTSPEFPYTNQDNREQQDILVAGWTLSSIDLPSGGHMDMEYESDDYRFVQDKRVMKMYQIAGVGTEQIPSGIGQNKLYSGNNHTKYLYVKLEDSPNLVAENLSILKDDFISDYLDGDKTMPVQFRVLMNMTKKSGAYDYVDGYFEIKDEALEIFANPDGTFVSIPLKFVGNEGGLIKSSREVNPIAKAGWFFGRKNLNREVYENGDGYTNDPAEIIKNLVGSIGEVFHIFSGPNKRLQDNGVAQFFNPEKSWIRLFNPKDKVGGGLRVQSVKLFDNWDLMSGHEGNQLYSQLYGQEYSYQDTEGRSSGVASFEPQGSRENPFIEPFYDDPTKGNEKLLAPPEFNYTEKPFGEAFFPYSRITYSKVNVQNLSREIKDGSGQITSSVKKHATGFTEHEFYTTRDYPTKVSITKIDKEMDPSREDGANIFDFSVESRDHLVLSQGYTIVTNDMNSKPKAQRIYDEQKELVSGINYRYNLDENGKLNSKLPTINRNGTINHDLSLGKTYDVINDFRENISTVEITGASVNATIFPIPPSPIPGFIPSAIPRNSFHETILRTATTTKVIHTSGIMVGKEVMDLGSTVNTRTIAWDADSGKEIITRTNNEYDDNYYNFLFPSYWAYPQMGFAAENIGIEGTLIPQKGDSYFRLNYNTVPGAIFKKGDELLVEDDNFNKNRFWVLGTNAEGTKVRLIDRHGVLIDPCGDSGIEYNFKIVRSGNRNLTSSSMGSITSVKNPIDQNDDNILEPLASSSFKFTSETDPDPKILNASVVLYKDFWRSQKESNLPVYPNDQTVNESGEIDEKFHHELNPYLYNIKGDWRPARSYAYLTSRQATSNISPRQEGFYSDFKPFYKLNTNSKWIQDATLSSNGRGWTFASEVTKLSPYGNELENRDALDRYSAAQYGYNYSLPIAVASNSQYAEMAFDGFEDYDFEGAGGNSHFSFPKTIASNPDVTITNVVSHSGRNSIKVSNGKKARITSDLKAENLATFQLPECEPIYNPSIIRIEAECKGSNCLLDNNYETFCEIKVRIDLGNLNPVERYSVEVNINRDTPGIITLVNNQGSTGYAYFNYQEGIYTQSESFEVILYKTQEIDRRVFYISSDDLNRLPNCIDE